MERRRRAVLNMVFGNDIDNLRRNPHDYFSGNKLFSDHLAQTCADHWDNGSNSGSRTRLQEPTAGL